MTPPSPNPEDLRFSSGSKIGEGRESQLHDDASIKVRDVAGSSGAGTRISFGDVTQAARAGQPQASPNAPPPMPRYLRHHLQADLTGGEVAHHPARFNVAIAAEEARKKIAR
jgi:hypothetical protein